MLPPHVLGPKYERRQRPRNSPGFRIGRIVGNLAMTPDVAGVISLNLQNLFSAPVDDNVTAPSTLQSTKYKTGGTPRPPLTEMEHRRATVTDALQSTTFRLYSSAAAPVTGARHRDTLCLGAKAQSAAGPARPVF